MVKQVTLSIIKKTLENTEGAIKNGQSRETGNIVYTRGRGKNNTICAWHHYMQTNTNKTWAILYTTGDKDEPNIVLWRNRKIPCWFYQKFQMSNNDTNNISTP